MKKDWTVIEEDDERSVNALFDKDRGRVVVCVINKTTDPKFGTMIDLTTDELENILSFAYGEMG